MYSTLSLGTKMADADDASKNVRLSSLPHSFLKARPGCADPTPRAVLSSVAVPFGFTGRVVLMHAARVAILEMTSASAAMAMVAHHARVPLIICGRPVTVGASDDFVRPTKPVDDAEAASQCERCIMSLITELERREQTANAVRRKERHLAHLATMQRVFAGQRFARGTCWASVLRGRACDRSGCALSHGEASPVHLCCAPPRLRNFVERETYPAEYREASDEKAAVNRRLAARAVEHCVTSRRCLVIDCPGGSAPSECH